MSKKKPVSMTKDERRSAAIKSAIKFARKVGAKRVSIAQVAVDQGVTAPLLFHIFESHAKFVAAVAREAKKQGIVLPESAPTVREMRAKNKPRVKVKPIAPPVKVVAVKAALLKKPKLAAPVKPEPAVRARKPLTPEQREAKNKADRERRAGAALTSAEKFAALPRPFEAAIKQVAA